MPLGVIELRDVAESSERGRTRKVKRRFISGTQFEVTGESLRQSGWGSMSLSDVDKDLDVEYEVVSNAATDVRRYAVVPEAIRSILAAYGCEHPGVTLDKFVHRSSSQAFVKHALQSVVHVNGEVVEQQGWYRNLLQRWHASMTVAKSVSPLQATTTGPLTLHLSRASFLENAGICLHPLYGFAYLPGSGLKGMARAYAETVWLPAQPEPDKKQAWKQIEGVFGWASNPEPNHPAEVRRQNDNDPDSPEIKSSSGNIIFHDAWPEVWPQLIVDIVNNHHPNYYQHDDNDHPPGDWENPIPVYFLAVQPGITFNFPLAKRRAEVSDDLLTLAREWLLGALCHLGVGAKTNAGYGAFKPASEDPPTLLSENYAIFGTPIELVTPAFLAGASQNKEDCELRPTTLRGLLRWWWRTMYAGFLDVPTLRALEAAIWGDTQSGGAVRIVVEKVSGEEPLPYDKRSKANFNQQQKQSQHGIPHEDPHKTTQGLWYVSYGMDEGQPPNRRQRYCLAPGARWHLGLIVKPALFFQNRKDAGNRKKHNHGIAIATEEVLSQAKSAVWLLCHYGAAGSKARKGFGSLSATNLENWGINKCRETARQLRQNLQLSGEFDKKRAHSPSLHQMLNPIEVRFSWPDIWEVIDQVGFAYESAAHEWAHDEGKLSLGLPRHIHGPRNQPLPYQSATNHRRPQRLRGPKGDRHSSPAHIHLERYAGNWLVRAVAFPAAHLPNLSTNQAFLEEFLKNFGEDLLRRAALPPPSDPGQSTRDSRHPAQAATKPDQPKPGDYVEAVLLEEKTRKGGWKAKHLPSGLAGPIQNTAAVPVEKQVGDPLRLIVANVTERQIDFRYPSPADEERAKRTTKKSKGKHSDSGGRGPRR